ncbi:MAG TPA: hypothetical protein VHY84_06200 [Bryobacteraceae bacterium]|jgi:hypothetical protein|nr:hypothetical protein [Bryobacteraceae bacterium]
MFLFIGALFLIVVCFAALRLLLKMRALRSAETTSRTSVAANRYRPMLRLLSNDDFAFLASNSKLLVDLRAKRRALFRAYLGCLTRDYAHLLASVRQAMVHSGVDRPDLARALARNRVLFAIAICKVEFRLMMHATGMGSVEISGLVEALETLRGQVSVLSTSAVAA